MTKLITILPKAELEHLVQQGKSDRHIAEMYGVDRSTIQRYRKKLGVEGVKKTPEKYDLTKINRMLECNLTYDDIAYIYGTSYKAIINFMYRKRKEEKESVEA